MIKFLLTSASLSHCPGFVLYGLLLGFLSNLSFLLPPGFFPLKPTSLQFKKNFGVYQNEEDIILNINAYYIILSGKRK